MLKIGKLQLIHVKRNNTSHHRKKQGCWWKQGAWDLALVEGGRSKGIIIGRHLAMGNMLKMPLPPFSPLNKKDIS